MAGSVVTVGTTATQLPFTATGVTVVNLSTETVTLSTAATFTSLTSYTIGPKSAMPVPVGPIYAKTAKSANVLVVPKLLNISNPNVKITGQTINIGTITGTVKVTVSGGNLNISGGTLNVGSITDTVTVGGSVTSLQQNGAVYSVGDHFVLLGTQKVAIDTTTHTASVTIGTSTVTSNFSALRVRVERFGATPPAPFCVKVTSSAFTGYWSAGLSPTTAGIWEAVIPGAYNEGHSLGAIIYFPSGTSGTVNIGIVGLTSNPGVQLRSDGRAYPIGSHVAASAVTGATATVIAAPSGSLRIMIRSIMFQANTKASGGFPSITCTTYGIIARMGTAGNIMHTWESGLLLPLGKAVKYSAAIAVNAGWSISYDLML